MIVPLAVARKLYLADGRAVMPIVPTITIVVLAMLSTISVVVRLDNFALVISARSHSSIPRLVRRSLGLILEIRRLAALCFIVVVFCLIIVDTSFVGKPAVGVISLVIGFVWALRRIKVEVLRLIRLRQVTGRGHSIARRVHHAAHSISLSLAPRCLVSPSVCPSSVSPVHRDRGRVCFQHFCRVQPQEDNQDGVNDAHTLTALVSQRNPPHPLPVVLTPRHQIGLRRRTRESRRAAPVESALPLPP